MVEGADRAQVDHVGGELRHHAVLEVGGDLHVLAAADGAQFLDTGDFGHEADAAGALDAARHVRLDQGAEVLFVNRALVLIIARAADAVAHRLVLEVTFAALVADRAIERMVDEEEFHHPFARLLDERCAGVDPVGRAIARRAQVVDAHGAGGDRLRHAVDLDQAHAAVAGDRKAFVIAEAGNFAACQLAGLKQRDAVFDFDFLVVNQELFRHSDVRSFLWAAPEDRRRGAERLRRCKLLWFSYNEFARDTRGRRPGQIHSGGHYRVDE